MIYRFTSEEWKDFWFRASALREARKQAKRSRRRVIIKVDGLQKVMIQPW